GANTHFDSDLVYSYLEPLIEHVIYTLVLGYTHYPSLRGTIEQVVGNAVHIVYSAETTAHTVREALGVTRGVDDPEYHFFVTDAEERFRRIAGEFLEHEIENLELVAL